MTQQKCKQQFTKMNKVKVTKKSPNNNSSNTCRDDKQEDEMMT